MEARELLLKYERKWDDFEGKTMARIFTLVEANTNGPTTLLLLLIDY
jgi:hypothetical protein